MDNRCGSLEDSSQAVDAAIVTGSTLGNRLGIVSSVDDDVRVNEKFVYLNSHSIVICGRHMIWRDVSLVTDYIKWQ